VRVLVGRARERFRVEFGRDKQSPKTNEAELSTLTKFKKD
jgi:hypothetical protein